MRIDPGRLPAFHSDHQMSLIGCGLLDRTLPKPAWTHAGHFTATLWLLANRPEMDLAREMPAIIRAYNNATGVANTESGGYHETITQASIRAARAFFADHPNQPLFDVGNLLMTSPLGRPEWLLTYWSHARLFSVQARRAWCEPDLISLPF